MESTAMDHKPLKDLLELPVGTLVDIFSFLPAGDLGKLRAVSKFTKALIDTYPNSITRQSILSNQERLQSDHGHLTFASSLPFVDLFRTIYTLLDEADMETIWHALIVAAEVVIFENPNGHGESGSIAGLPIPKDNLPEYPLGNVVNVTGDESFLHIVEPMREAKRTLVFPPGGTGLTRKPECWITWQKRPREDPACRLAVDKVELLAAALGVPELSGRRRWLCFCVRSRKVFDLVLKVCSRDVIKVTALEKAVILEDLSVW
ncbi:uncharacterized protein LTR77_005078 [Saxophila tyrrhenica]|uniref:F-box domain-containing protein n=1 Tax=Saxophila tyrrhenica TaxID=1690608 RepID=A0AAV9PF90_9PEZI|nr:hypothetical protein LTR77_005078 [Saxophila tyrrhenica]